MAYDAEAVATRGGPAATRSSISGNEPRHPLSSSDHQVAPAARSGSTTEAAASTSGSVRPRAVPQAMMALDELANDPYRMPAAASQAARSTRTAVSWLPAWKLMRSSARTASSA